MYRLASSVTRASVPLGAAVLCFGIPSFGSSTPTTTVPVLSSSSSSSSSSSDPVTTIKKDTVVPILSSLWNPPKLALAQLLSSSSSTIYCESSTAASGTSSSSSSSPLPDDDDNDSSKVTSTVDDDDENENAPPPGSYQPGDFAYKEDEHSFMIHPMDGIVLMLQTSIGTPGQGGAAVAAQTSFATGGFQTVWILSDQQSPSLQAVLQPAGQEGRILKVTTGFRPVTLPFNLSNGPIPGLNVEFEGLFTTEAITGGKITTKYAPSRGDFHSVFALQPWGGPNTPPNFEFNYHQTVIPPGTLSTKGLWAGTFTAGGSLSGGLDSVVPIPSIQRLLWGTYGSYENRSHTTWLGWKLGQQPKPDGTSVNTLGVKYWHRINKGLELGSFIDINTHSLFVPADSNFGIGGKLSFEGMGGIANTVTGQVTRNGVASVQVALPTASMISQTFMRTTLTGVFDHQNKDYKYGAQIEMYY